MSLNALSNISIIALIVFGGASIILILYLRHQNRIMRSFRFIKPYTKGNRYTFLYNFYMTVPGIKSIFAKVMNKTAAIYPSDPLSINRRATLIMTRYIMIAIVFGILSFIFAGGDIFFVILSLFILFVTFRALIDDRLHKLEYKLLEGFAQFISNFPMKYRENHGLLEEALLDSIDSVPYEIGLHVSKIYDIITSPYMTEQLDEYVDYAPNRYILMFVSLCATVKEYGDQTLPDGNTAFIRSMINLEKQINTDLLKYQDTDGAFKALPYIAILPVLAIKPIEWWGLFSFPSAQAFYHSSLGTAAMAVCFLVAYWAYSRVMFLKNGTNETVKLTSIWQKISNIPIISTALNTFIKQHYTSVIKKDNILRSMGDRTGPKAFIVRSVCYAIATFIALQLLFTTSMVQSVISITANIADDFQNVIGANDNTLVAMEEMTKFLIEEHKKETTLDQDSLINEIIARNSELKRDEITEQISDIVIARITQYHKIYYKWWYMLISILLSILAYFLPTLSLQFSHKTIHTGKEDEIGAFNSLMLIFMNLAGMTIDTVLEWIERFAFFYREDISECIIELSRDERKALQKLKDSDTSAEFQKFVSGLLAIDEVGIKDAFVDLEIQQDYYNRRREIYNKNVTSARAGSATRAAFASLWTPIIFYLIIPIGAYGIQSISNLSNMLNF